MILISIISIASVNGSTTLNSTKVECTSQNCIISYFNMDDEKFDEIISEDQSGILALKFTSCEMDKIPKSTFNKLPSLLCLMITNPGLLNIEEGNFIGGSSLQFLYLPGNRIKNLHKDTFKGASMLSEINLSENEIVTVNEETFNELEHLESLNLSQNKIAFFAQSTFSSLINLLNLDISGNIIEFLDVRLFINNRNLNGINIANNQILSITNGFMDIIPQIKVLNIMQNPCTKDTALENVPLIKIIDSKERNFEDENSLETCYQNFLNLADPESTDFEDLLEKTEIVRDDIEADIIADLNNKLRGQDITIKELEREEDVLKIFVLLIISVILFFTLLKVIIHIVNNTHQIERKEKIEAVHVDPKQVVYSIEI